MNPCLAGFRQFLEILAEPSAAAQPRQSALHHLPARQYLEAMAVWIAPHHAQYPSPSGPSPLHQLASIGGIGPDQLEPGEPAQQLAQHQLGAVPVLDVGRMYHYCQEQAGRIHYDVAFAPRYLLVGVIAPRPPFSVAFTDWLSMMAALGVASRPSLSRTWLRSASSTRSQVPSARHFRKYHHTVPQGGRSWAPFATVCRLAIRTVCRLPPPLVPLSVAALWPTWEATKPPNAPTGNASNHWDMLSGSYPQVTLLPPACTKLLLGDFTIFLTHPLRLPANFRYFFLTFGLTKLNSGNGIKFGGVAWVR